MDRSYAKRAVVLGLLAAMGPFAIDMYLPALPAIGQSLHAPPTIVQRSLMSFFVSVGVCQLIYGPLADMFGRRRPLIVGLALFAVASVACAFAPSIEALIGLRFIQGLGACASMVIPLAIVRDLYTGTAAARLMALLMLVLSVSPLLAPLAGSLAIAWTSWRAVFWVVAVLALLGLALTVFALPETRPPEQRLESGVGQAFRSYGKLLRDARFVGLCAMGGFSMSAFFIYLANSSFVLIDHYHLAPAVYSLFFSVNALAFIGAAQFTARLSERWGLANVVRFGASGHALMMVSLGVLWACGAQSLALMSVLLFFGYGFLGLSLPNITVLALDAHGAIAGSASALLGTVEMLTAASIVAVASEFADGTPAPMVLGIALTASCTVSLTWLTLRGARGEDHVAELEPLHQQ